jgi:hypothetical protein
MIPAIPFISAKAPCKDDALFFDLHSQLWPA